MEALGQLGNDRAVKPLLLALQDEDEDVRRSAAEVLGQLGDDRAVEPLLLALQDEDKDVRRNAAKALGQLGDDRAVKRLFLALQDEDEDVRRNAAEALAQLGEVALTPLLRVLKHENWDVRSSAAEALGQLGGIALVPLLLALQDEDWDVRCIAAEALSQLSGGYVKVEKIASALWWQFARNLTEIDNNIFLALTTVVNRFPITAPIDDLLLPSKATHRRQLRWWAGMLITAILSVAVSATTGVLGNLLSDWLDIGALQGVPLAIGTAVVVIVSIALVIMSQMSSDRSP